jgi:superfamily I DNA and RNA helicase
MDTATLANHMRKRSSSFWFFYAKKQVDLSNIVVKMSTVSTKCVLFGTLFDGYEVRQVSRSKPVVFLNQSFHDQSIVVFLRGKCSVNELIR